MTIYDCSNKLRSEVGNFYSNEEKDQIIFLIFEELLGYNKLDIRFKSSMVLSEEITDKFSQIIKRLVKNEPIQYILGHSWFAGMKLKVDPSVLIPRQETEELVDWIIKENKDDAPTIIDICSGSGCIGLALKKSIPNSIVHGIDVSIEALKVSNQNSELQHLKVDFLQQDILNSGLTFSNIDIIVSNPPYVRQSEAKQMKLNVTDYEPHLALFVKDNDALIFYKRIVSLAKNSLKTGGKLYFEINENLSKETADILEINGFQNIQIRKDLNDRYRMICAMK